MQETPARKTRNKLARIYGLGILAFTVIVGFLTLLAKFLASASWT
jgi:t-SNARE complex subunit (syntaxin)